MAFSGGWSVGEGVSASMLPGLARDGLALTSGGAKRGAGAVRRGRGLEEKIVIGRVCVRSWVAFGAGWSVAVRRSAGRRPVDGDVRGIDSGCGKRLGPGQCIQDGCKTSSPRYETKRIGSLSDACAVPQPCMKSPVASGRLHTGKGDGLVVASTGPLST